MGSSIAMLNKENPVSLDLTSVPFALGIVPVRLCEYRRVHPAAMTDAAMTSARRLSFFDNWILPEIWTWSDESDESIQTPDYPRVTPRQSEAEYSMADVGVWFRLFLERRSSTWASLPDGIVSGGRAWDPADPQDSRRSFELRRSSARTRRRVGWPGDLPVRGAGAAPARSPRRRGILDAPVGGQRSRRGRARGVTSGQLLIDSGSNPREAVQELLSILEPVILRRIIDGSPRAMPRSSACWRRNPGLGTLRRLPRAPEPDLEAPGSFQPRGTRGRDPGPSGGSLHPGWTASRAPVSI